MIKVPDEHKKSVVFLCIDKIDKDNEVVNKEIRIPKATGFYVRVPLAQDVWILYLVTARHCIEMARKEDIHKKLYVRHNLKTGVYKDAETSVDDWYCSDSADVATIPIEGIKLPRDLSLNDIDHDSIWIESFVGNRPHYDYEYHFIDGGVQMIRPDVGHEVFFVGLFEHHYKGKQNVPIARFGHIAMMPSNVKMKLPGSVDFEGVAYLVECQAWGGSSGSPVFAIVPYLEIKRQIVSNDIKLLSDANFKWVVVFMGILNGHYPLLQKTKSTNVLSKDEYEIETELNSGIAIVTPAEAIRQLLMENDELKEQRDKILKDHEKDEILPTLDFGQSKTIIDEGLNK